MTARTILQVFNQYQNARLQFVQVIAELARRPHNVKCLENIGVLNLLHPLLSDDVLSIQQMAALALGRLATHSSKIAQTAIRKDVIQQLIHNIEKQNKYYKTAAFFALRALSKHSSELAYAVVQSGGLDALVLGLEDFDTGVKEAAAWAIGYIARHNKHLAQTVIDAGSVPLLILCLQEPELCLKHISISALCDISKHTTELAQIVVDAGIISCTVKSISNPDVKLKRQAMSLLSCIAKNSSELAEMVVEADIYPEVLIYMAHPDEYVVKAATVLTKEICKHTLELSQLIVNTGGISALIEVINTTKLSRVPAIISLGYIAGHSDQHAMAIIGSNGVIQLATLLQEVSDDDHILGITAWTLGQIGKHSPEHAKAIAASNILAKLIELYNNSKSSDDLKAKCKSTLKQVLQKCINIDVLESLLYIAPPEIVKYVLGQFSKILPNDSKARRMFVTTGGLKKVQQIQAEPGSALLEYIKIINCCFPEEIVRFYSPGYIDTFLEAVEQYQPKCSSLSATARKLSSNLSNSSGSLLRDNDV